MELIIKGSHGGHLPASVLKSRWRRNIAYLGINDYGLGHQPPVGLVALVEEFGVFLRNSR
jgi:hypothetical protein